MHTSEAFLANVLTTKGPSRSEASADARPERAKSVSGAFWWLAERIRLQNRAHCRSHCLLRTNSARAVGSSSLAFSQSLRLRVNGWWLPRLGQL